MIGSNNSAHDICADLWEHGVDVTMVQRSSTHIAWSESLMDLALGDLYSEKALANGVATEKADLLFASLTYRILTEAQVPVHQELARQDAEFYSQLEAAGFDLDFGVDGSGLFLKYLRRGSGYSINVGASELIIDGPVKLKSGQVAKITGNAVVMDDGTELEADLIVHASGYGPMNGWLADLVSPEIADRVGKCWGYGSDGSAAATGTSTWRGPSSSLPRGTRTRSRTRNPR
ncbi:cation diffusion facilitator CzcD-associated flavoprotein CzcO [Arthrobacter globiformis]|nr:cation diffusion facilitator CzcD-associated flavoprotein CzcO [Arthrobacter globiformis]